MQNSKNCREAHCTKKHSLHFILWKALCCHRGDANTKASGQQHTMLVQSNRSKQHANNDKIIAAVTTSHSCKAAPVGYKCYSVSRHLISRQSPLGLYFILPPEALLLHQHSLKPFDPVLLLLKTEYCNAIKV